jgi:rhamnose transport system permease protein
MSETTTEPQPTSSPPSPEATGGSTAVSLLRTGLVRWESALVVFLVATIIFGASESSNFMYKSNIFYIGLNMGEIAIMALPLTLIVITGEIDLSVASMLGLSSTLMGYFFHRGFPIWQCVVICLVVGIAGGALNGVLITRLGLPSIAVTIGTLTLFRGIAEIVLGTNSITGFPTSLTNIGVKPIGRSEFSWSIGIFIGLAVICGVVLHLTPLGRSIYAIGLQPEAAHFSGIRVNWIKMWLYIASGLVCSFAGILWTFRFATSRYDAGTGLELTVVAIVLLGGVSIFGGRGTILGVALAVVIFGCIQEALTLMNVAAQVQNIVTGALLLLSVVIPNSAEIAKRLQQRMRRRANAP